MGKKSKRNGKSNKLTGKEKGRQGASTAPVPSSASAVGKNGPDTEIDKMVTLRIAELADAAEKNKDVNLRFSVGDRIQCCIETNPFGGDLDIRSLQQEFGGLCVHDFLTGANVGSWSNGVVTQRWVCTYGSSDKHPYQVRLDDGSLHSVVSNFFFYLTFVI